MKEYVKRTAQKEVFLADFFKSDKFSITPITGDAGLRDYYRITSDNNSYILMDCPPSYADITPFIKVANYLNSIDLIAPSIYAVDQENGFILLQDFGNHSAGDFVSNMTDHQQKLNFYKLSIDILCQLQKNTPPANLPEYDNELLLSEIDLFIQWYMPYANGTTPIDSEIKRFHDIWQSITEKRPLFCQTTVLRDYHVQNMMILDENHTTKSLGLLDFQDALLGSPIYDLVSILEDARIKVPRSLATQALEYYSTKTGLDYDQIMLEYSILGAQRNMRILGVFARKAMRDKATSYLNFIPTVLEYISYDFSHPALSKLSDWMSQNVKMPVYEVVQ